MDLSPLRKFEVLGPGRRGAAAGDDHARRAAALGRPGHLHGRVQRGRRDDRRRHGVPPGPGQLPVRRRRRLRRRLAEGAGRAARAARLGQALDRPAAQRRRPGAGEPRDPARGRLDPARAGARSTTWGGSASSWAACGAPDGIPIVVSRTGYTGELGYEVWCHPDDAAAVWDAIWEAGEPRGLAPFGLDALDMRSDRGGADRRRQRVRPAGRPVRGGDRLRGRPAGGRGLRRARRARGAQGPPAADARRARGRGQRDGRARRPRVRRAPGDRRRDLGHPFAGAEGDDRARARGGRVRRARDRASRSASSTASRSGSRPPSSGSRSTTRTRPARGPRRGDRRRRRAARTLHRRAGRVVLARRLPDRRGGPDRPPRARTPPRALPAAVRGRVRDRDPARRGELGQGPRSRGPHAAALQRVEVGHGDRGAGALGADRAARGAADGVRGRSDPAGQRAVEAAGDQGDRVPPGRLVRGLPRPARDGDVLDVAARDGRRRGADRLRPRLEPLGRLAALAGAVPRARGLAGRRSGRAARRRVRARDRPGRGQGRRRRVPPQRDVARLGAEPRAARSPGWGSCRTCCPRTRASTRRTST